MKAITIKRSQIVADEKQPRRYFNAEKMRTLKDSISKYGIMNPIVVQEVGKDKYLLVDGERRFRVAGLLKLNEVPAIIEKPTTELERRLRQFNIQEQHAEWTMQEKALAIVSLADTLKQSVAKTCELLNVTESDKKKYVAFAGIAGKDQWVKSEMPFEYARYVNSVVSTADRLSKEELEKEFTMADRKKIEMKIIRLVKSGVISRREEITKLKDAFAKSPKSIARFMDEASATPTSLFSDTKARGANYLRRSINHAGWLTTYINKFLEVNDVKPSPAQVALLKRAQGSIKVLLASVK